MAKLSELEQFVRDALSAGKRRPEVREVLVEAGWQPRHVDEALFAYCDIPFPVAVPRPRYFTTPQVFFANLFYFILLYTVVLTAMGMLFEVVDYLFPKDAHYMKWHMDDIRWAFARLAVCFPLLVWLHRKLGAVQALSNMPVPPVRIILINLTLFLGMSAMLCAAVWILAQLLSGEGLAVPLLKSGIFAVTLAGFHGFYKEELRQEKTYR